MIDHRDTETQSRKRGLLIAPEFPADSFWSYRYIMKMIGSKTAFPPLGLLTFAASMPDHWDFHLVDLNVCDPSAERLREQISEADAVFASAMSIQKRSLVELLEGPARGLDTPWVLGGPFPSTYRDLILSPGNESDQVLHDGLDLLVWGEGAQWIPTINKFLQENPNHSSETPELFIPEAVAKAEPGRRKYLNDREIFEPLTHQPPPRWDLVDPSDYRSLMIQTTVGCPFRCEFCDIIDFNGGFTRVKTLEDVRAELEAIYETGHRGGVFTVDDNFIGNPSQISKVLDVITEFQREHDYPFALYTQASVNLGTEKLQYLIEKMKRAGFTAVFLGIENPDPAALNVMNKKQNKMVSIPETVRKIQGEGIEVYAGFIFGNDTDTPQTAGEIVRFVEQTWISTAMTGLLTPVPHTPLYQRLKESGRLLAAEYTGNNTDDAIQFRPEKMTIDEMRTGICQILENLFNPSDYYRRACSTLSNVKKHIYWQQMVNATDLKAALRSLWIQGIRRVDREYFKLLWHAISLDRQERRQAKCKRREIDELLRSTSRGALHVVQTERQSLDTLEVYAQEYLIRTRPEMSLEQIRKTTSGWQDQLQSGRVTPESLQRLGQSARGFFDTVARQSRFPGQYLAHAFELAIKGLHYERVMENIVHKRGGTVLSGYSGPHS